MTRGVTLFEVHYGTPLHCTLAHTEKGIRKKMQLRSKLRDSRSLAERGARFKLHGTGSSDSAPSSLIVRQSPVGVSAGLANIAAQHWQAGWWLCGGCQYLRVFLRGLVKKHKLTVGGETHKGHHLRNRAPSFQRIRQLFCSNVPPQPGVLQQVLSRCSQLLIAHEAALHEAQALS